MTELRLSAGPTLGVMLASLEAYRVGAGRDLLWLRIAWRRRDWHGARVTLRRMLRDGRSRWWWGLWQAELDGSGLNGSGLNAQRGLTEDGARWAMYRAWDRAGRPASVLWRTP